jgi:hypothetical protein
MCHKYQSQEAGNTFITTGGISLLHHGDTEGTVVPTLQGTTQTLTTTQR